MTAVLPAWAARYIGIPFIDLGRSIDGADCWGVLKLLHAERYQNELPDHTGYRGTGAADAEDIRRLFEEERNSGDWLPIKPGLEREGDAIEMLLLEDGKRIPHVGIVIVPGIGIHTMTGSGSTQLRYRDFVSRNVVTGFHRHRRLVA